MRIVLGAVFAIASGLSVAALQQREQRPTITVETDLVLLPVTVTDRHGAPVAGLSKEQFTVYDNGEPQAIEFFTSDEMPATLGLVIDSSSSMRGRREQVTAAATAFAHLSSPLDELFSVNFNEVVWLGLPRPVAFARSVEQLQLALARAPAVGMTALYDAVAFALDHLQQGTRDRKALVVVSDGGDNASRQTFDHVLDLARRTNTAIYAVILFDKDDAEARPAVLKRLARETGGEALTPARSQDVMNAFTHIAREIRSGYTLGFSPPAAADAAFRSIRVVALGGDRRELVVHTRPGYYYPGRSPEDRR